jgi:ABC-type antimicrobial peptide transport system permease subunit
VATAAFAAVALSLTIVGLLVVVSRVVIERRRELAIRSALGATFAQVVRTAASPVIMAITAGVLVGVGTASAAARLLEQFLFQVAPRQPSVYAAVAGLVLGVALLAALFPVRSIGKHSLVSVLNAE